MKLAKILILIILAGSMSAAKIYHEHTSTVAGYDDYVYAYAKLGEDLGRRTMAQISEAPVESLGKIFGSEVVAELKKRLTIQASEDLFLEKIKTMTFRELAGWLRVVFHSHGYTHVTNNEVMRSFFEYTRLNEKHRGDWSYLAIGWDFRLYAQDFLMDQKNGGKYLFESFLKRTPLSQRTVVSITANAFQEFFKPQNALVMEQVRQEFLKAGSKLEWIGGITRSSLQKLEPEGESVHGKFQETINKISELLQRGMISGIDITGSIVENSKKYIELSEKTETVLFERMQMLYDTLADSKVQGQLKIHMYESTPEGEFYEVFFASLKSQLSKKGLAGIPPIIRVGHVNALRPQDIARFKELSEIKDRFVFEANLDSNTNLKKANPEKIASNINELVEAGFRVRLGTDGVGIFGPISYFDSTIERLSNAGLNEASLRQIVSGSDQYLFRNRNYDRYENHLQCKMFYH